MSNNIYFDPLILDTDKLKTENPSVKEILK